MTKVIGVRFRQAGKVYFFSPGKLHVKQGDKVIVETARGVEFGRVVTGPKDVKDEEITQPLKSVIRVATEEDKRNEEKNREKIGSTIDVLCEDYDPVSEYYFGRSAADAPEIDGKVFFKSERKIAQGEFVKVKVRRVEEYDLCGFAIGG